MSAIKFKAKEVDVVVLFLKWENGDVWKTIFFKGQVISDEKLNIFKVFDEIKIMASNDLFEIHN